MIPSSSEIDVLTTERRVALALMHPAFSEWLKQALRSALDRDPVVLANDLELLQHLLLPWSAARIARDHESRGTAGTPGANAGTVRA